LVDFWSQYAEPVTANSPDGVLITGVYGSGKSSVAAEIAFVLEGRGESFALLDLDFLGWGGVPGRGRASEVALLAENLAAVTANYRRAGVGRFVLAWFVRTSAELDVIRAAVGMPLRVVRLIVPLEQIGQRLATDVTSGRRDDLLAAAESIAADEGSGLEELVISNDQPIATVAEQVLAFLRWNSAPAGR
jgi:hypothetical protein